MRKVVKNKSKNKKQVGPLSFFAFKYICKGIEISQSLVFDLKEKIYFLDSGTYINKTLF